MYDVVFLSYKEPNRFENYKKLKIIVPQAFHVHGIEGIVNAHKYAASLVKTLFFWVVDADNEVETYFKFDYKHNDFTDPCVCIWHAYNPVNGMMYGYGGIKLFPTEAVLNYNGSPLDFTTNVADDIYIMPEVASTLRYDTDPYSTWKSAFRESVKLYLKSEFDKDIEARERLKVWTTTATGEFAQYSIMGALSGIQFAQDNPHEIHKINNFGWLKDQFTINCKDQ